MWHSSASIAADYSSGFSRILARAAKTLTQIGQLHMQRADRSGGCLYKASNGILPLSEHITIWFFSHVVCLSALPHIILGRLLVCISAWIHSSRVWFSCSTKPFN